MSDLNSGNVPEPIELASDWLDSVSGGQAIAFVKQSNRGRISIGNHDTVTGTGTVYVGTNNMAMSTQANSNTGTVTATDSHTSTTSG